VIKPFRNREVTEATREKTEEKRLEGEGMTVELV